MNKSYIIFAFVLCSFFSQAQNQTVGLFSQSAGVEEGYTLFNSLFGTDTYLIDNCGRTINHWESSYTPGNGVYFLEDGTLLKTSKTSRESNPVFNFGGAGEKVEKLSWDNEVLWEYTYSNENHRMHHDVAPLPNGNVLILAWELKTSAEAIAAGRNPDLIATDVMWFEHVIEVDPSTDEIVWDWHVFDHLVQDFDQTKQNFGVVVDSPQLFDVNFVDETSADGRPNWMHINSIDYNEVLDQIVLSSRFLNEIYIIDHSTTREESAGHTGGQRKKGGDILYRWGNPESYDHGTSTDQKLFGQHNAHWIPKVGNSDEEKIMIFNNGFGRPEGDFSSVEVIFPNADEYFPGNYLYYNGQSYGPDVSEWIYLAETPTDFYSSYISGAQRLPNGNTLICSGATGHFFEIDANKDIVWDYVNPATDIGPLGREDEIHFLNGRDSNAAFRALKYPVDYAGFTGLNLVPGESIEKNAIIADGCVVMSVDKRREKLVVYPNPATNKFSIQSETSYLNISIYNSTGLMIYEGIENKKEVEINTSQWVRGVYLIRVNERLEKIIIEN